jgi:hypothetical protein
LPSIAPFCTVSEDYLRRGELLSVSILDSELNLFKIIEVRELGRAGIFGWRLGFKGKYLRVEPVLQLEKKLNLEAAKRYVFEFLSAHPGVYESEMPLAQLLSTVMAAHSPVELMDFL